MKRYRDITAMWPRLRGPALRLLIGGGLLAPAAVLMGGRSGQTPVTIPGVLAVEASGVAAERGIVVPFTGVAAAPWTEDEVAPPEGGREEAPDWSTALESAGLEDVPTAEPRLAVATFAREFKIPVTLAAQIHSAAVAEKIKPRIAFGLVKAESSFRTKAVSPVGAVGLTQLLPSTARWLVPGTTRSDLMTPETNLRVGFRYLRHLLDQYDGNEKLALTAYNRGPGTVARILKRGRDPDNGYAEKVLTGNSTRHVRLMNAKFGSKRSRRG